MTKLLLALGREANLCQRISLISLFVMMSMGFVALAHVLNTFLQWNPLIIQVVGWAIWFAWQGWLFPLNRARYIRNCPSNSYRKAFYRDILFGVSFGISQMIIPISYGFLATTPFPSSVGWVFIGLSCIAVGAALLALGFKTIGIAGAGFLSEYRDALPLLAHHSVYAYIRHPLFLGGVVASSGACFILSNDTWSLALATLNVAILPVYGRIEDNRLSRVFGAQYLEYSSSVGRFVPKLSLLRQLRSSGTTNGTESAQTFAVPNHQRSHSTYLQQ